MLTRRSVWSGLIAAPAIVAVQNIMPVRSLARLNLIGDGVGLTTISHPPLLRLIDLAIEQNKRIEERREVIVPVYHVNMDSAVYEIRSTMKDARAELVFPDGRTKRLLLSGQPTMTLVASDSVVVSCSDLQMA